MNKSTILLAFIAAVSLFAFGCGDKKLKTYPVSGVVTYNGTPVDGATIVFAPTKEGVGDAASAKTDAKGEYKLTTANGRDGAGTTPGEYSVIIKKVSFVETGKTTTDPSSGKTSPVMQQQSGLPDKYGSYGSPQFKETVEAKKNVFNFDLTD